MLLNNDYSSSVTFLHRHVIGNSFPDLRKDLFKLYGIIICVLLTEYTLNIFRNLHSHAYRLIR